MIFPDIGNCLNPFADKYFNEWKPKSEKIIRLVCKNHQITADQFHGNNRSRILVVARWEAWTLMAENLGMSFQQIARRCNRDPSTIRYGISKYREIKEAA